MSLNYSSNSETIIQRLRVAHDPSKAIIRGQFFEAEYDFFRKKIRNQRVLVAGSGLGHDSFELVKYNQKVVGIEILEDLVTISCQNKRDLDINNVQFYKEDLFSYNPSVPFDTSVLNMGTIGNFDNKPELIKSLLSYSSRLCLDFYLEDESSLITRKKMYEEEGWKNVRIKGMKIISDDGLESKSISKFELSDIVNNVGFSVRYHTLNHFSEMAEIEVHQ